MLQLKYRQDMDAEATGIFFMSPSLSMSRKGSTQRGGLIFGIARETSKMALELRIAVERNAAQAPETVI